MNGSLPEDGIGTSCQTGERAGNQEPHPFPVNLILFIRNAAKEGYRKTEKLCMYSAFEIFGFERVRFNA
jgi:hypothetical protein